MTNPINDAIKGAADAAASGALTELDTSTLPQVQADVQADIDRAMLELSNTIKAALEGAQASVNTLVVALGPFQELAKSFTVAVDNLNAGEKVTVTFQLGGSKG